MSTDCSDITIDTTRVDQTMRLGAAIGRCCEAMDVIALEGELGAGKTQLVRGLAEGMGLDPRLVSSPTFVMVQEYEPSGEDRASQPILVHIDAYRIQSDDELATIGWDGEGEALREGAVLAVEWASLIERALGADVLWLRIDHAPHGRRMTLTPRGVWRARMPRLREAIERSGLFGQSHNDL